jgi:hypothetical protein
VVEDLTGDEGGEEHEAEGVAGVEVDPEDEEGREEPEAVDAFPLEEVEEVGDGGGEEEGDKLGAGGPDDGGGRGGEDEDEGAEERTALHLAVDEGEGGGGDEAHPEAEAGVGEVVKEPIEDDLAEPAVVDPGGTLAGVGEDVGLEDAALLQGDAAGLEVPPGVGGHGGAGGHGEDGDEEDGGGEAVGVELEEGVFHRLILGTGWRAPRASPCGRGRRRCDRS